MHKAFLQPPGAPVNKNLSFKTAKHSQNRDFSARQDKQTTARLTPAVVFWCSIAGKDPFGSV
jgi:hypothetical protein